MVRKRRRSNVADKADTLAKRPKRAFRLTDLPLELLSMILGYAIPDHRDLRLFLDPKCTANMYTTSILQVSRYFRRRGLNIIDRRCVWISFKLRGPSERLIRWLTSWRGIQMSEVPPSFRYLIPGNAPTITVEFRTSISWKPKIGFMCPFNFAHLIRLCEKLSCERDEVEIEGIYPTLSLKYDNMTSSLWWQEASELVVPALNRFKGFVSVASEPPLKSLGRDLWALRVTYKPDDHQPDLIDLFDEVTCVLKCADEMKSQGYLDEAGLFVLANIEHLSYRSVEILPLPPAWAGGEVNPWSPNHKGSGSNLAGLCARGNQLRNLLMELLMRACFAYERLTKEYGTVWCHQQRWYLGLRAVIRGQYTELSFGLTTRGLCQLHHARAIFFYVDRKAYDRIRKVLRPRPRYVPMAAREIYFAHMLQPDDPVVQQYHKRYMSQLRARARHRILEDCKHRFKTISFFVEGVGNSNAEWTGDTRLLKIWGGSQILQFLPLAQNLTLKEDYLADELAERRIRKNTTLGNHLE